MVVAIEKLVQEQINGVVRKTLREPTVGTPVCLWDAVNETNNIGVQAIFLVGGFGSSPYLSRRLQEMTKAIPIVRPEEACVSAPHP